MLNPEILARFRTQVWQHNHTHSLAKMQERNSGYMRYASTPHFVSNELDCAEVQYYLANNKVRHSEQHLSVAILTGAAYFLSRLPEFQGQFDVILLADIHPAIHDHTRYQQQCMLDNPTLEGFRRAYLDPQKNPILREQYILKNMHIRDPDNLEEYITQDECVLTADILDDFQESNRQHILPKYHFLYNESRYRHCRQALLQLTVLNLHWDWTDTAMISAFKHQLGALPVHVNFAHISNVQDYDANRPIRELFKQDEPIKLHFNVVRSVEILCADTPSPVLNFSRCYAKSGNIQLHSVIAQGCAALREQYMTHERDANADLAKKNQSSSADTLDLQQQIDLFTDITKQYDFSAPLTLHTSTQRLNDMIQQQWGWQERWVAYWNSSQEYIVDAMIALDQDKAIYLHSFLSSKKIETTLIDLKGMHRLLIIPHLNIGGKNSTPEYIGNMHAPAVPHNLELAEHFHRVIATLLTTNFYSDCSSQQLLHINQFMKAARKHENCNTLIIALSNLIDILLPWLQSYAGKQSLSHRTALPEKFLGQGILHTLNAPNLGLMMMSALTNIYSTLIHSKVMKQMDILKRTKIEPTPCYEKAQFGDYQSVYNKIKKICDKDATASKLHWETNISDPSAPSTQTTTSFSRREDACTIARLLKANGIHACLWREKNQSQVTYRVIIPNVKQYLIAQNNPVKIKGI